MTIEVALTCNFEGGGLGHVLRGGTGGSPTLFANGTVVIDRRLAVSATVTLWDATVDTPDFDFLFILAEAAIRIELVVGAANRKTTLLIQPGVPWPLGGDDAGVGVEDALETITQINARSSDGVAVANVRLVAIS